MFYLVQGRVRRTNTSDTDTAVREICTLWSNLRAVPFALFERQKSIGELLNGDFDLDS